jgi:hypothetical protein
MPEKTVKVSLSITDSVPMEAVLAEASAVGFQQEAVMPRLGVATGTVPVNALVELRAVRGVEAVETARTFRIA